MSLTISLRKSADDESLFPEAADAATVDENWYQPGCEGQLAVDVFDAPREMILRAAIAGVRSDDLEVTMHNDMLTIRGRRQPPPVESEAKPVVGECHWGSFSRSLIMPTEIDADRISAELHDGILTVRLPKIERSKHISVKTK